MAGRIDAAFIIVPCERVPKVVRFELHVVKQRDEDWTRPQWMEVAMDGPGATIRTDSVAPPISGRKKTEKGVEEAVQLLLKHADVPTMAAKAIAAGAMAKLLKCRRKNVIEAVKLLHKQELFAMLPQKPFPLYYRIPGDTDG